MKTIFKSNLFSLAILLGLSLILISATSRYILTINFFDNSGEYFSGNPERESSVFDAIQKYIYFTAILYTLFRLFIVSLIIHTALYLTGAEISFSKCFKIVVNSEFIFLLAALLKIIWFKTAYPNGTLSDWHKTYVFSALSLADNAAPVWYYPLQTLNLFEVGYWFLLAFGIHKETNLSYDDALRTVVSSYVPALFIWVVIITFCSVMLFPTAA